MTARTSTVVEVDAATVYAEGMLAGLCTASNLIERSGAGLLTARQRKAIEAVFSACAAESGSSPFWRAQEKALLSAVSGLELSVPPHVHSKIREWRAIVYHNEWLAKNGRPADLPAFPDRSALLARIHAFLLTFPDTDHAD